VGTLLACWQRGDENPVLLSYIARRPFFFQGKKRMSGLLELDFVSRKERSDEVLHYDGEVVKLLLDIWSVVACFCGDLCWLFMASW